MSYHNDAQVLDARPSAAPLAAMAAFVAAAQELARRIAQRADALADAMYREMLRRRTIRELQSLSDATLRDIGIPRTSIRDVAADVVGRR